MNRPGILFCFPVCLRPRACSYPHRSTPPTTPKSWSKPRFTRRPFSRKSLPPSVRRHATSKRQCLSRRPRNTTARIVTTTESSTRSSIARIHPTKNTRQLSFWWDRSTNRQWPTTAPIIDNTRLTTAFISTTSEWRVSGSPTPSIPTSDNA